jgi:hypothetical protein
VIKAYVQAQVSHGDPTADAPCSLRKSLSTCTLLPRTHTPVLTQSTANRSHRASGCCTPLQAIIRTQLPFWTPIRSDDPRKGVGTSGGMGRGSRQVLNQYSDAGFKYIYTYLLGADREPSCMGAAQDACEGSERASLREAKMVRKASASRCTRRKA